MPEKFCFAQHISHPYRTGRAVAAFSEIQKRQRGVPNIFETVSRGPLNRIYALDGNR